MCQNFRVRLTFKNMPLFDQVIPQRLVILNHSIVNQHQFATRILVRVRVLIRRCPVRRPARMTDPRSPLRIQVTHRLPQRLNPACPLHQLQLMPYPKKRHAR